MIPMPSAACRAAVVGSKPNSAATTDASSSLTISRWASSSTAPPDDEPAQEREGWTMLTLTRRAVIVGGKAAAALAGPTLAQTYGGAGVRAADFARLQHRIPAVDDHAGPGAGIEARDPAGRWRAADQLADHRWRQQHQRRHVGAIPGHRGDRHSRIPSAARPHTGRQAGADRHQLAQLRGALAKFHQSPAEVAHGLRAGRPDCGARHQDVVCRRGAADGGRQAVRDRELRRAGPAHGRHAAP